jgi:type II secretory pathway component PulL
MEHFLSWFIPTLKFAAIFISGASGILSLMVEFKDKQHRITRWGRRAVIMVVVSFLVSAVMQVIEIHQGHEREIAENKKTQNILDNINRQLYNINL